MIRFIQQSVDTSRLFYVGRFETLSQLYKQHRYIISETFPNAMRLQRTLQDQGFISLLDDELNIEYRIEVS